MPLSWNEIRTRAIAFSQEWKDEASERAEAKSFWDAFFHVFGVPRRRVATLEHHVNKAGDQAGYIDLFWPGVLVAEHKSRGRNLERAFDQAIDYFPGIPDHHLPRYVVVSDFARFRIHDLETGEQSEIPIEDLHEHIQLFGFIAGYESRQFKEQDPVNVKAADRLGNLHDGLLDFGYTGHELEVYLVRILFCLFAEDTGIFLPRGQFSDLIERRTREDGSDLGAFLSEVFEVLNTPHDKRLKSRDEQLLDLPFVNGKLFEERLRTAAFDSRLRTLLLECCDLDWGQISPAIFGSLFQGILDQEVRRNLGAHYTSEQNILKLIHPLFLDELWVEFERVKRQRKKLEAFHEKLGQLQFMDPACGCGNFLVIAYRELRELELEVIRTLYGKEKQQLSLDAIEMYVKVDVDQFHGIEVEEWPAQIAQVAMWLIDHQMNVAVSQEFGNAFVRIPLVKSANIVHGNAVQMDWNEVLPANRCNFLMGNPPFVGHQWRTEAQKEDMRKIWGDDGRYRRLDYVSCWYWLAAEYMNQNPEVRTALVSTNSICQGEQVGILWPWLLEQGVIIQFAHRTFQWKNEAPGVAGVHCVIVGFGMSPADQPLIFDYGQDVRGDPQVIQAKRINPYLVDADDVILPSRTKAPEGMPQLIKGSQPTDGGNLILNDEERDELIEQHPITEAWIRPYIGGRELINGTNRWCLWLRDVPPAEMRKVPPVMARLEAVRKARENSPTASVRDYAKHPSLFTQDRQPDHRYIAVPEVSSERRRFIPIGFLSPEVVASNQLQIIQSSDLFIFGVLCSTMHNAWMRAAAGRLESRYRYAPSVYNNLPWPRTLSKAKREKVENAASAVLEARENHPESALKDLYDPLSMPRDLVNAHDYLDRAVDAAYGRRRFKAEADRVAFLFELYQKHTDEK